LDADIPKPLHGVPEEVTGNTTNGREVFAAVHESAFGTKRTY